MGFQLIDNGNKFTTPHQLLSLLDVVESYPEEKLDIFVFFFWDNTEPKKFKLLMEQTFNLEYEGLERDLKGNFIIRFKDKRVSLRWKNEWFWTWTDFKKLVQDQLKDIGM